MIQSQAWFASMEGQAFYMGRGGAGVLYGQGGYGIVRIVRKYNAYFFTLLLLSVA